MGPALTGGEPRRHLALNPPDRIRPQLHPGRELALLLEGPNGVRGEPGARHHGGQSEDRVGLEFEGIGWHGVLYTAHARGGGRVPIGPGAIEPDRYRLSLNARSAWW